MGKRQRKPARRKVGLNKVNNSDKSAGRETEAERRAEVKTRVTHKRGINTDPTDVQKLVTESY